MATGSGPSFARPRRRLTSAGTSTKGRKGSRPLVAIAVADLVMADGVSLEGSGVTPDELLIPSGEDLASGRDPVATRAAVVAGLEIEGGISLRYLPYSDPDPDPSYRRTKGQAVASGPSGSASSPPWTT